LDGQILILNGFVNPYSQVKWIFSTKMAQDKALILFKRNSRSRRRPIAAPCSNAAIRVQAVQLIAAYVAPESRIAF
jgi:hypothetical protein